MSMKSFIANKVKTVLKQDIENYSDSLDGVTEISQSTFDSYIDEISDKLYNFFNFSKYKLSICFSNSVLIASPSNKSAIISIAISREIILALCILSISCIFEKVLSDIISNDSGISYLTLEFTPL